MLKPIHRNMFPLLVQTLGHTEPAVEVGVAEGNYSREFLKLWPNRFFMVDRWCHIEGYDDVMNGPDSEHEERFRQASEVAGEHADRVTILRMDSAEAAAQFADRSLSFVYLDGDHSYDGVCRDIQAWAIKLKPNGILAGHDYYNKPPFEVRRAVAELCGGPCGITLEASPSWWVVVQ
jgi:hypothetical protein